MFFSFKTVEIGDIEKEINNIDPKKATTSNSIPPKILKILLKLQPVFCINCLAIQ